MSDKISGFRPLPAAPAGDGAGWVRHIERRWRARVTIHDPGGLLRQAPGGPLLPEACFGHRGGACRRDRERDGAAEMACIAHCWKAAHAITAREDRPVEHRCWRGQREIVVPVFLNQVSVLTVFLRPAGRWPNARRLGAMAADARMLGQTLLRLADAGDTGADAAPGDQDRRRRLRHLLAICAQQPRDTNPVARALGVSPSRASHIVTALFGKPWRELLADARIERAKQLLARKSLSVAQVAELCGYADAGAFNRIFSKREGVAPGRWRVRRA